MISWVTKVATGSDSVSLSRRNQLLIPATTASKVSAVTDAKTCTKAAKAYATIVGVSYVAGHPVYVVKANTVYIVQDSTVKAGEFARGVVFDRQFALLEKFID